MNFLKFSCCASCANLSFVIKILIEFWKYTKEEQQ